MASVVIYDPSDVTVPSRVINYLQSVNTPDYESNPNTLINPDLFSVIGIDQRYWKVVNSVIISMTNPEKTAIDNLFLAKTNREKKYQIATYSSQGRVQIETWYDQTDGNGSYSGIAELTTYTYDVNTLLNKVVSTYYYNGTVQIAYRHSYFMNDAGQIIEKIEEI